MSTTKKSKPTPFKKGQSVTMLFHMYGLTSEEDYTIVKVGRGTITLDTDEDESKRFVFNTKTGTCLNDNTWGGARRTLKLES